MSAPQRSITSSGLSTFFRLFDIFAMMRSSFWPLSLWIHSLSPFASASSVGIRRPVSSLNAKLSTMPWLNRLWNGSFVETSPRS